MKNFDTHDKIKIKQFVGLLNGDHLSTLNSGVNNINELKCLTKQCDFDATICYSKNLNLDLRSQSLPDCSSNESQLNASLEDCDCSKSHYEDNSSSPRSESWFKSFRTWPERYEKLKNVETHLPHSSETGSPTKSINTQESCHCDHVDNSNNKNKLSFNEAVQNISLAYSPITKQLHLVDNLKSCEIDCKTLKDVGNVNENLKKGHKRNEAGSFSSTVSSWSAVSDPSTSGSLIGSDDRSVSSFDISNLKSRRKSLTNFLSKHVFTWKGSNEPTTSGSVWKIFSKPSSQSVHVSPVHGVASSSALIQHERPSNLPAKSQSEEQRHKDEYKAILVAAKKKEAESSVAKQKQQKLQLKLEEQQAASTKHFTQNVLPNWNNMRSHKKTLELWWQGIPSSVRGKVWRLAIGNELNLTPQLYDICLNRAQNRLNSTEILETHSDAESSMDVIQLDISRTFPHLGIFQKGGPFSEALHSLLAAYVCYRPDVGYVQGMSYIAAILILNMEPCDAFICFSNLLNQPLHLSAFTLNQSRMQTYYNAYDQIFSHNLPKLHAHFSISGLTPDLYLLDWIYTIFAKAMPLDIACRVWDVFLRDGSEFIFRTALGILYLHQDFLMSMDFLQGAQFLTHLPEDISADSLFKSIQFVNTTIGKQTFIQIVEKCEFS